MEYKLKTAAFGVMHYFAYANMLCLGSKSIPWVLPISNLKGRQQSWQTCA